MTEVKTPTPDPTILTTDSLRREIAASTSLTDAKLEALSQRLDTKIDGNAALSEERHAFTRRELIAGEERRLEHKEDTRTTVDTAFRNAGAAITESKATATDKIRSVESTVSDLKDRVLRLETQQQTKTETRDDSRSNIGMIVGIAGALFGLIVIVLALLRDFSA